MRKEYCVRAKLHPMTLTLQLFFPLVFRALLPRLDSDSAKVSPYRILRIPVSVSMVLANSIWVAVTSKARAEVFVRTNDASSAMNDWSRRSGSLFQV